MCVFNQVWICCPCPHPAFQPSFCVFHALFATFSKFDSFAEKEIREEEKYKKSFFCCSEHLLFPLPLSPLLSFHFFYLFLVFVFWSSDETCLFSPATVLHFSRLLSVKIHLSSPFFRPSEPFLTEMRAYLVSLFILGLSFCHFTLPCRIFFPFLSLPRPLLLFCKITRSLLSDISCLTAWVIPSDLHICIKLQGNLLNYEGTHTRTHT